MKQAIQYFQLFCNIAGLNQLTNKRLEHCFGISNQWEIEKRMDIGIYFLKRAFQIFKGEGEKQIFLDDIG
jgi:hypothetical protein